MSDNVTAKTRPRKVFGRVRCEMNGSGTVVFEMTKTGLRFRPLRSRKAVTFTFPQLLDFGQGQLPLPFNKL